MREVEKEDLESGLLCSRPRPDAVVWIISLVGRRRHISMSAAYNFHCHEADADQHVDFLLVFTVLILDGSEDARLVPEGVASLPRERCWLPVGFLS
jgi:hypothetical protein